MYNTLFQSANTGSDNKALKERVERLETMCKYCGDKMESYLGKLLLLLAVMLSPMSYHGS